MMMMIRGRGGVSSNMMVYDSGGVGVKNDWKNDDVICEWPPISCQKMTWKIRIFYFWLHHISSGIEKNIVKNSYKLKGDG